MPIGMVDAVRPDPWPSILLPLLAGEGLQKRPAQCRMRGAGPSGRRGDALEACPDVGQGKREARNLTSSPVGDSADQPQAPVGMRWGGPAGSRLALAHRV